MEYFNKYYIEVFKRYKDFQTRATRKEFWMFALFGIIVNIIVSVIDSSMKSNLLSLCLFVVSLVPTLAVNSRRLHDTNHSGWWQSFFYVPVLAGSGASLILLKMPSLASFNYLSSLIIVWLVLGIILSIGAIMTFIFLIKDSNPGDNKYGPNPKGITSVPPVATATPAAQ